MSLNHKRFGRKDLFSILAILLIPAAIAVIGWFLFSLSFLLPTDLIKANLNRSADSITEETMDLEGLPDYAAAKNDGWSESIILAMTVCPTEPDETWKAPLILRYVTADPDDGEPLDSFQSLRKYVSDPDPSYTIGTNNRYWNGLVMVLKGLLCFLPLNEVRLFGMLVQLVLLCLIIWRMSELQMKREMIPFLFMIFMINPVTLGMSLKLVPEYVIMLLGCLAVLHMKEATIRDSVKMGIFFSLTGALTSFFNMLSFPLVTLGVPLLIQLWRLNRKGEVRFGSALVCVLSWMFGYFFCWGLKWLFCTLFTEENLLQNVLSRAESYHSVDEDLITVVLRNLSVYDNRLTRSLLLAGIILPIINEAVKHRRRSSYRMAYGLCLLAGVILPVLFFILFGPGYAYTHHFMAYRNLVISAGALMSLSFAPVKDTQ